MRPIDLTVGDAVAVRRRAVEHLGCPATVGVDPANGMGYDASKVCPALVELIEDVHPGRKAIVSCGAMHGLNVVVRAMKEDGLTTVHLRRPHWGPMVDMLDTLGIVRNATETFERREADGFFLLVSPNNPDGSVLSDDEVGLVVGSGAPVVFDAAYDHPHYLNDGESPRGLGGIVVHSVSKMLGMSALRVGFVLCESASFAARLRRIVDVTTCGTSTLSQSLAASMLERYWRDVEARAAFEASVRADLRRARENVEDAVSRFLRSKPPVGRGMFGWYDADVGVFDAADVVCYAGERFGRPGMVRINIAAGDERIDEACDRLRAI